MGWRGGWGACGPIPGTSHSSMATPAADRLPADPEALERRAAPNSAGDTPRTLSSAARRIRQLGTPVGSDCMRGGSGAVQRCVSQHIPGSTNTHRWTNWALPRHAHGAMSGFCEATISSSSHSSSKQMRQTRRSASPVDGMPWVKVYSRWKARGLSIWPVGDEETKLHGSLHHAARRNIHGAGRG